MVCLTILMMRKSSYDPGRQTRMQTCVRACACMCVDVCLC